MVEGKTLLTYNTSYPVLPQVYAAALIYGERDDGDDEPVKLIGNYNGDKFKLHAIEVGEYSVVFT